VPDATAPPTVIAWPAHEDHPDKPSLHGLLLHPIRCHISILQAVQSPWGLYQPRGDCTPGGLFSSPQSHLPAGSDGEDGSLHAGMILFLPLSHLPAGSDGEDGSLHAGMILFLTLSHLPAGSDGEDGSLHAVHLQTILTFLHL